MASGFSTRFWPLNRRHKSLIEIAGKPLIRRTVEGLRSSGIEDIVIVHKPEDREILEEYLGDLPITLVEHRIEEIRGSRSVLKVAYSSIKKYDKILMLAPYHVEASRLKDELLEKLEDSEVSLVLAPMKGTEQYGNAFVEADRIIRVLEKKRVTSGRKISAIYAFRSSLVERIVSEGEALYDRVGENVLEYILDEIARKRGIPFVEASLPSLKYPRHVLDRLKILLDRLPKAYGEPRSFERGGAIVKNSIVSDDVEIKHGAYIENSVLLGGEVFEYAVIKNSFIGSNAIIGNHSIVRDSSIGKDSIVGAHIEIARSVLEEDVHTHSGYIGDSIIDRGSRIGAGIVTANVRFDRKEIRVRLLDGRIVDTRRKRLGLILGAETLVGIHVSSMPGTLVGSKSIIYPHNSISGSYPDGSVIR